MNVAPAPKADAGIIFRHDGTATAVPNARMATRRRAQRQISQPPGQRATAKTR